MEWDLGPRGLVTLLAMAMACGVLAQIFSGKQATKWLWLIVSAFYFVAGLLISEAMFGWATEEELQPNIDGLSFDETLLGGIIILVAATIIARRISKRIGRGGPRTA